MYENEVEEFVDYVKQNSTASDYIDWLVDWYDDWKEL